MNGNYLRLFARNLVRHKMFSAINLLGLTTGIFSTLLIYIYVRHETSYDRFHERAEQIYRINQTFIWGDDNDQQFSSLGPGVSHAISSEIPEVKEVTRLHPPGSSLLQYTYNDKTVSFDQTGILAVDSNFFRVFTFPLLKGDPITALQEPNSIVMTESTAKKYFGDQDPLGKVVQAGNFVVDQNIKGSQSGELTSYVITGVVADPPANSYIDFDLLVSMTSLPRVKRSSWSWVWTMFETYVVLDDRATPEALREKLSKLPRKYAEATLQNAMGTSYDEYTKSGKQWNLYAQPIADIHLHSSNIYNRFPNAGNARTVYVLIGIVGFIILLSCINFMNLSTAQYTRRARETSLRKVLGSSRWQLSKTFFVEAFLFCSISLLIAIGLTQAALPLFNQLSGTNYAFDLLSDPFASIVMASVLFAMSILAGSYPALFLSAFKPVDALKGKLRTGRQGKVIRNSLVVFQFSISLILIIGTMVVFQQLQFLGEKDTGFDRENLLVLNRVEWVQDKNTFFNDVMRIQGVENVSLCSSAPPRLYDGDAFKAEDALDKTVNLNYVKADEEFGETLKLLIVTGRYFAKDRPADKQGVILNETAIRNLGWQVDESSLGKRIQYPGDNQWFEVIGIVRDFNYWSLNAPIDPMAIFNINNDLFSSPQQYAALRLSGESPAQWNQVISSIESSWKKFAGDAPFQYHFVDDAFAESFAEQDLFGKALAFFAALTILIASLGLLGMIVFTLELKTKEIGIRKVIGATVWNILSLISKEYTRLIVISIAVSIPITLWMMNKWLEEFQYRINISPLTFVTAGSFILLIALFITGYHSLKAALTNPVDVLKDE